jgi:hypothetical protein
MKAQCDEDGRRMLLREHAAVIPRKTCHKKSTRCYSVSDINNDRFIDTNKWTNNVKINLIVDRNAQLSDLALENEGAACLLDT